MADEPEEQAEEWDTIITHMISSSSLVRAAEKIGCSDKTLQRLMKNQAFVVRLRARKRELVEQSLGILQNAMSQAVVTLLSLLKRDDEPNVQCRAAGLILTHGVGALSLLDLETRVAALEQTAQEDTA